MSAVFAFAAYGGPENQQLIEREAPQPRPDEVVIRVRAAGVNPADAKRREGAFGTKGTLPVAMGLEVAGVVTAVGEDVDDVAVGDEVLGPPARGQGSFAEHTVLKASKVVRKPAEVSFEVAATLPVAGTTAYDMIHQVPTGPGGGLVVLGAGGGVGLLALQVARADGLTTIGVASPAKRELVEGTGAVFVSSGPGVADRVREHLPEGVDRLVDLVGGDPLRELAPVIVDPSGIVSAADPDTATELGGAGRASSDEALARVSEMVAEGLVSPHIGASYPLAQAAEAMAEVESGHAAGKVVIIPSPID